MSEANASNPDQAVDVTNISVLKSRSTDTRLSSRGGALVLRSLSLFLAHSRKNKKAAQPAVGVSLAATKCDKRKMNDNSKNFGKCSARLMESLKRDTHFNKDAIDALLKIYRKLVACSKMNMMYMNSLNIGHTTAISKSNKIQEGVDRIVFQELLHNTFNLVTEETLMDRIFCAWDKNNEGLLKAEIWIGGLSVFLRGTFDEKIQYCFRVYDLNSDGFISKDEMFQLFKNCLVKQPQEEDPDEGVKDLVEIILRKLDIDRDGKVSFKDYENAVKFEPLLLEAFGQCLPTDGACLTFLSTLQV